MLAAVLHDFYRLVLEEVPVPEPGLGEVVVRIHSCGVCATDYKDAQRTGDKMSIGNLAQAVRT